MVEILTVAYHSNSHFPSWNDNLEKSCFNPYRTIVIDNGDTKCDGDVVIHTEDNLKWTAAVNRGLRKSRGDYILLCHPDIRFLPGWDQIMIKEMQEMGADLAGAILVDHRLHIQQAGGQDYPELDDAALITKRNPRFQCGGSRYQAAIMVQYPKPVRWISGACLMLSRNALEHLGWLDENYPHHHADVEYCVRAGKQGLKIICSSMMALQIGMCCNAPLHSVNQRIARFERNLNSLPG
jgi:GT2 family glycosyltransferase